MYFFCFQSNFHVSNIVYVFNLHCFQCTFPIYILPSIIEFWNIGIPTIKQCQWINKIAIDWKQVQMLCSWYSDLSKVFKLMLKAQSKSNIKCTMEKNRAANQRSAFSLSFTLAPYIRNRFGLSYWPRSKDNAHAIWKPGE